jgi:hypothetical protein
MTESFDDPQLRELLADMAVQLSQEFDWPHERAVAVARDYAAKARQHYRAEGAPFGDDEMGLHRWLTELSQPSPNRMPQTIAIDARPALNQIGAQIVAAANIDAHTLLRVHGPGGALAALVDYLDREGITVVDENGAAYDPLPALRRHLEIMASVSAT